MTVNSQEAPRGYKALPIVHFCEGCSFRCTESCPKYKTGKLACLFENRKDKEPVIFVKE